VLELRIRQETFQVRLNRLAKNSSSFSPFQFLQLIIYLIFKRNTNHFVRYFNRYFIVILIVILIVVLIVINDLY